MRPSLARAAFVDRMAALIKAVELDALVPNGPVADKQDPSRLLRNGLAVVAYSAFEDFFSARTSEALESIDSTHISFGQLPERLIEAATVGAVRAMNFRMGFENPGPDRRGFVQQHAQFLFSTTTSAYRFSPLTFSPSSSNLAIEDIERALKCLLVDDPWQQLFQIASRTGYGGVGLRERLRQVLLQRNEAAHAAEADIGVADLRQLPHDLLAVAVAFDAVFSRAVSKMMEREPSSDPNGKFTKISETIEIVFLDVEQKVVKETAEGSSRAKKNHQTLENALRESTQRAKRTRSIVVVRDAQRRPIDWRITEL